MRRPARRSPEHQSGLLQSHEIDRDLVDLETSDQAEELRGRV